MWAAAIGESKEELLQLLSLTFAADVLFWIHQNWKVSCFNVVLATWEPFDLLRQCVLQSWWRRLIRAWNVAFCDSILRKICFSFLILLETLSLSFSERVENKEILGGFFSRFIFKPGLWLSGLRCGSNLSMDFMASFFLRFSLHCDKTIKSSRAMSTSSSLSSSLFFL